MGRYKYPECEIWIAKNGNQILMENNVLNAARSTSFHETSAQKH